MHVSMTSGDEGEGVGGRGCVYLSNTSVHLCGYPLCSLNIRSCKCKRKKRIKEEAKRKSKGEKLKILESCVCYSAELLISLGLLKRIEFV